MDREWDAEIKQYHPWSVETIEAGDIEFRQGRHETELVDETVGQLTEYVT